MITGFSITVAICSVVVAAVCCVLAARKRQPGNLILGAVGFLEVLLVAQTIIAIVLIIGGKHPSSMATFIGYLIGSLVVLPIGAVWALAERSRSSTMVLVLACVVIPVLVLRMEQVWGGAHA